MSFAFFIRRPILTCVCSAMLFLAGLLAIHSLPVAQYPDLAPPQIKVTATYVGANSDVVESAVTTPLEQELNGAEGMRYMTSSSGNDGVSDITITFDVSRNLDAAAIDVQNRIARAAARLPAQVIQAGLLVNKASTTPLMNLVLLSPDDRYDITFLSNYADVNLRDAFKRVPGVGEVRILGERKFSMRIWLDPTQLARRKITAIDVSRALQEQNVQVAAGQIGQPPSSSTQAYQIPVRAQGRLVEPAEFGEIVVQSAANGAVVRIRDVGRVELGAETYNQRARTGGHDAVVLQIVALPTANALEVRDAIMQELERMSPRFPPGLAYRVALDSTLVIRDSLRDMVRTLIEAIVLVMVVLFVFLQGWRPVLITALTLPVSLLGTFAFVKLFGLSINIFTLFALTLATGLVVDDAIVVVENIDRLREQGRLRAGESALASMQEVGPAIVAISIALIAVFAPVALFPGVVGIIFREFALTISAAVVLSTFCALTLTPALSALLLGHPAKPSAFHRAVDATNATAHGAYRKLLAPLLRRPLISVWFFFACLAGVAALAWTLPRGFLPDEDQSYFTLNVQGPEGLPLAQTEKVLARLEQLASQEPEVALTYALAGGNTFGTSPNLGYVSVRLKPVRERPGPEHSAAAVLNRLRSPVERFGEMRVIPTLPPPTRGFGSLTGFQLSVQDTTGTRTLDDLSGVVDSLVARAGRDPNLHGVFTPFSAASPVYSLAIDRQKAKAVGVPLDQVFATLQIFMSSQYVNDFNFASRVYRVYVQAEQEFRDSPQDIAAFYVRNEAGEMIPLESLVRLTPETGASAIRHYNMFRSAEINGQSAIGKSTGQGLDAMQRIAEQELPEGMATAWTGLSLEQAQSGGQIYAIFGIGLLFVFLVLAALYESLVLPAVIILSVPLALLGALGFQALRGLPNDVFCQIGLVILVGLASKNAILIVEFAEQLRRAGKTLLEAALEASATRLRPILMTSIALLFGVIPLVIASGAGSAARQSLGTTVFGGLLTSTVINLFLIPSFYVLAQKLRTRQVTSTPVKATPGSIVVGAPPR